MENRENNKNEEIKEILEGLSSDDSTVVISEGDTDGKLEFHFEGTKKSGLVFEEVEVSDSELHFESEAPVDLTKEEPIAEELSVEPAAESADVKEELSIPEDFDVEEESAIVDDNNKVWTTYVPRFTEVSETYRMNDDPRPRPEKTEKAEKSVVAEIVESDEALDATDESLEGAGNVDAVVINLSQKNEAPEEQTFSVYKFSDESESDVPAPEVRERTVEDERAEIEDLVHRKTASSQEVEEKIEEKPQELKATEKPRSYKLPDPDEQIRVIECDAEKKENPADIPTGANEITSDKKHKNSEFTANAQRDSFKDRFLDSIMSVRIRLVAAVALTLALLVFENLIFLGVNPAQLLGLQALPGAMAIADLQFALCIFALALPEICSAFRKLIRGSVAPEISLVFSMMVLVAYTLIVAFENPIYVDGSKYPLFGLLFAAQGLATVLGTYCKRSADFIAFKRVSVVGEKKVLDMKLTRTLDRENLALDGAVDEIKSKTTRVFKTEFVSDFFKRTGTPVEEDGGVAITLCVSLGAALVGAIIAFFIGDGWLSAAVTFAAIALFTIPAVTVLIHKLPFFYSARKFESEESAVIGEASLYDYSGVDVVALDDVDVFGHEDVSLKRIIHYGGVDNVMKAMSQMSALFSVVGGPLDFIFANSLDRKCAPATNVTVEQDGICGKVEGHEVCAGTAEYMLRRGIELPSDADSARAGISESTKVMFAAEDGVIYVQFHIRYAFSEEFAGALPRLSQEKVVTLVYTRDPNVSGDLMKILTGGEDSIRVMKRYTTKTGEDKTYKSISAGAVTSGDKLDAVGIVLLAKKYVKLMKKLSIASLIAMASGLVLATVLAITGALTISSVAFFGWQAVWCLAFYIVARTGFTIKKKEVNSDDQ